MIDPFSLPSLMGYLCVMTLRSAITALTGYGIRKKMMQEIQIINAYMKERIITNADIEIEIRDRMNMIKRR